MVAEGDSWFNHPCINEVMDWFKRLGYAPYRSDAPGRTLATMVSEKVYLKLLADPDVKAVLLSDGGNDLINWKLAYGRCADAYSPKRQGVVDPELTGSTTENWWRR